MSKVFVSYRRDDSADAAGRLHDRLCSEFGTGSVFIDVDNIPFGVDFRKHLASAVGKCDVLLAIIGDSWLDARDSEGNRRLDDKSDFVRIEIASALQRKIPVIPVLTGRNSVPKPEQLPDDLRELAYRNAAEIRAGAHFNSQVERLVKSIRKDQRKKQQTSSPKQAVPRQKARTARNPSQQPTHDSPKSRKPPVARDDAHPQATWTALSIVKHLLLLKQPTSTAAKVFRVLFRSGFILATLIWLLMFKIAGIGNDDYDIALVFQSFVFMYGPLYLFVWLPSVLIEKRFRNQGKEP